MAIFNCVGGGGGISSVDESIVGGDKWVSGTTYAVGDTCIYDNVAYRCVVANSSSTFTSSEWETVNLKKLKEITIQSFTEPTLTLGANACTWFSFVNQPTDTTYNWHVLNVGTGTGNVALNDIMEDNGFRLRNFTSSSVSLPNVKTTWLGIKK